MRQSLPWLISCPVAVIREVRPLPLEAQALPLAWRRSPPASSQDSFPPRGITLAVASQLPAPVCHVRAEENKKL